jgi:hypothetical protein
MSDEIEIDDGIDGGDQVQDKKQKKSSKHDSGAADLERVTDYAEEREIKPGKHDLSNMVSHRALESRRHLDTSLHSLFFHLSQAANVFITKREKENEARLAKERELQKVQVKKEDIELIVSSEF